MNPTLKKWFLFSALIFIWGSSFILMKRGMEVYSSSQVIAIRIVCAFLVLSPFIIKYAQKSILKHWLPILTIGVFGILLPGFLFVEAQKGINSATVSMINSLVPLFTVLFMVLFFKEKIKLVNFIGILIGFVGASGLMLINKTGDIGGSLYYMLYALIAVISNGLVVVVIKYYLGSVNSVAITVWALVFIGPISAIYLFTTDFTQLLHSNPLALNSLAYIALLGIFGTALSIIMFNILIKTASPVFAASVTYLVPVVAILWGVMDGEVVSLSHILCISIILAGVYLVNKKPKATLVP